MKICYLANAQSIHTKRWARHFSDHGHQVTVVSFHPGFVENVSLIQLPQKLHWRRLDILLKIGSVKRIVKKVNPDILHAHYVTSYGLAGALANWHPFVATAWGTDVLIEPEKSWMYRRMVYFSLEQADLITSMAPHMTELMLKRGYANSEKIITLPFGVDTDLFNLQKRSRLHEKSRCLVVTTRRLDEGLDVDTFIRAIPRIIQSHADTRFIIAGDGTLRGNLERLAGELNVAQHVEFFGEIPHHQMSKLLGEADIFISTSPSDGNNISLNEAMACGTFPIATDIPANRAWIKNRETGLLYQCKDADELADAIITAIEQPEWRQSVMPLNWEIITTKASWSKNMDIMESNYRKLLSRAEQNGNSKTQ